MFHSLCLLCSRSSTSRLASWARSLEILGSNFAGSASEVLTISVQSSLLLTQHGQTYNTLGQEVVSS